MFAWAAQTKTSVIGCAVTLTKPAKNTTAASARFRIIRWIISITGCWKSSPRAMLRPLENILIPRLYCGTKTIAMGPARRLASVAGALLILCSICSAQPAAKAKPRTAADPAFTEKQLEKLSRALKQPNPSPAYVQLSALASRKSSGTLGLRASLALGYYDYTKGNYAQAAKWLARAQGEPLVADYALYWAAETDLASGHSADALAELKRFRSEYPDSVMTDAALQSLGDAALAASQPGEAVTALEAYPQTTQRPALLLLRGEASEQAGKAPDAGADFQRVYLRFVLDEQARQAGVKLGFLRTSMGATYPPLALDQRLTHAAMLFGAKSWSDARSEYAALVGELAGA